MNQTDVEEGSKQLTAQPQTMTLEKALKEMQKALKDMKAAFEKSQDDAKKLKEVLAFQDKLYQEIDKTFQNYEQSKDAIRSQRNKADALLKTAQQELEDSLSGSTLTEVKKRWDDQEEAIQDLEKAIKALEGEDELSLQGDSQETIQSAQTRLANAQLHLRKAQTAYDDKKQVLSRLQAWLKEFDASEKLMTKEKEQGNLTVAYVHWLDMQHTLTNIDKEIGYKPGQDLYDVWLLLVEKQKAVVDARGELDAKTKELNERKQGLADANKKRIDAICVQIKA
jgi:prophage DNA circulation protein